MTVIALSIEPGTLDRRCAAELAAALGLRLVDLRAFERLIAEAGGDIRINNSCGVGGSPAVDHWAISSEKLAVRIREQILEEASLGQVLIVGWCAPVILRPLESVVCLAMRAPMVLRESNIMRDLVYSDRWMARMDIECMEASIGGYVRQLFAADWRDPDLFDLVFNVGHAPTPVCAELVQMLARNVQFQETPRSRERLSKLLNALRQTTTPTPT
jgi:cytidylate kinase